MFILKYFYEEPASLELLSSDVDPDARRQHSEELTLDAFLNQKKYFRGYLSATDLDDRRFGLTMLPKDVLISLVTFILAGRPASLWLANASEPSSDLTLLCDRPHDILGITGGGAPTEASVVSLMAADDRRRSLHLLRPILDIGSVVLLPEPAHDGIDLSVFAGSPLRPSVEAALEAVASETTRAFSIPHKRARSEEKFYFELYDLDRFNEWEVS
jgi:hypothetical protein